MPQLMCTCLLLPLSLRSLSTFLHAALSHQNLQEQVQTRASRLTAHSAGQFRPTLFCRAPSCPFQDVPAASWSLLPPDSAGA